MFKSSQLINNQNLNLALYLLFRKQCSKQLQIRHFYGDDDDEEIDTELDENEIQTITQAAINMNRAPASLPGYSEVPVALPQGATVSIGGKRCRCGSQTHVRTSHRDCPHNKKNSKNV